MTMWLNLASLAALPAPPAPLAPSTSAADRQSYQRAQARTPSPPAAGTVQAQQRDGVRQSAALRAPAGAAAKGTRAAPARDEARRHGASAGHQGATSLRHDEPAAAGGASAGKPAPRGPADQVAGIGAPPGQSGAAGPLDALAQALAEKIAAGPPGEALFELLLPGGQRLAVLVARDAAGLQLWLTPEDAGLKQALFARRMELEGALTRRMGQAARITVL